MQINDIRPINKSDFMVSLRQVKATVSKKDLTCYFEWNSQFGSFELNMEEIDTWKQNNIIYAFIFYIVI